MRETKLYPGPEPTSDETASFTEYRPNPIATIEDFNKCCDFFDPSYWIFRGETVSGDKEHDKIELKSSFDKACENASVKTGDRWQYEAVMLREFKRVVHHYERDIPKEKEYLEWFALARHYGMPSRFIDFTYSIYIAAYFAFAEAEEKQDAIIWAINLKWLKDIANHKEIDYKKSKFHEFFIKKSECFVVPVRPEKLNERIVVQQGQFLGPCAVESTFMENLLSLENKGDGGLKKNFRLIRISVNLKKKMLTKLRLMNISYATLFPGLDGFTRSLKDYFYLYPELYDPTEDELRRAMGMKKRKKFKNVSSINSISKTRSSPVV